MWEVVHHPFLLRAWTAPDSYSVAYEQIKSVARPAQRVSDLDEQIFEDVMLLCHGLTPDKLIRLLLSET